MRRKQPKCGACHGKGWLLVSVESNPEDLRIQRCDACDQFLSDSRATQHVAKLASRQERANAANR